MDREKNIPSTEEEVSRKTKREAKALTADSNPGNLIHNGRQLNRQQEMNKTHQRGLVIMLLRQWVLRESRKRPPRFQHQSRS